MEQLLDLDTYPHLEHGSLRSAEFETNLCEAERLLQEKADMDVDYKDYLLRILHKAKGLEPHGELLQEKADMEVDYKDYLLRIPHKAKGLEPHGELMEEDDDVSEPSDDSSDSEEDDPDYGRFLKCLKKHHNSYMVEEERNGVAVVIKYEGYASSDEEWDQGTTMERVRSAMKLKCGLSSQTPCVENQSKFDLQSQSIEKATNLTMRKRLKSAMKLESGLSDQMPCAENQSKLNMQSKSNEKATNLTPRKRLRSSMKPENGLSDQMPCAENQSKLDMQSTPTEMSKNPFHRKSRMKSKSEKVVNAKFSGDDTAIDPDYDTFCKYAKVVNGQYVYAYGSNRVVYEENSEGNSQVKEEHDDEHHSDVEILDKSTFYEMNKNSLLSLGYHEARSEFRQQIIPVLRKPFNENEYNKLWLQVVDRKPVKRHREFRGGRDRLCSTNKDGKSYLDLHPDLRRLFTRFQDDKPKCLNILRGFFFWIQNFLKDGSFQPWKDAECLAISQDSC